MTEQPENMPDQPENMPEQPENWKDGLRQRVVDEVEYIRNAFSEATHGEIEIGVARSHGRVDYLFAERRMLVREEYLGRVLETLQSPQERAERAEGAERERDPEVDRRRLERDHAGQIERVISGVVLLELTDKHPPTREALDRIDDELGRGIATPDHVLTVTSGEGTPCSATEPQEVYDDVEPYPSVCPHGAGAGVSIFIDDTGLLAGADATHPWLAGVHGDPDPLPPVGADGVQAIPEYTGHGTFVAGVARCMAPAAEIFVSRVLAVAGSQLESHWIRRLEHALGRGVDIFHLSVVTHSRHDLPLITFREWLRHLREYGGAVCVVAAGNDGTRWLAWPAAFSDVISVGALGSDWRGRASFSNYGSWVDVYAPGRDLVNAYATGTYTCNVYPYGGTDRTFYGMAKWSGTSFSTPIVTGLIAARMSRTGETARHAAAAVLAEARSHAIPGVGPVLFPRCGGCGGCGCGGGGCGCGGGGCSGGRGEHPAGHGCRCRTPCPGPERPGPPFG
ncbi:MAG TPA: S8 family serine peptidase [Streptosporangiaceae bacterium]|nr:S8 family serine peptidase [Streptosporangiaceae bacterium]